ncbi:MAG TPA: type II secretion system protein [Verrucomicrobiae bacterium]|jgi:prepilin-type N-terminal cleavage/methylation domain
MSLMPKASKNIRFGSRDGFSLVELLVVIAIIGVLSSILLPALAKAKARAQGVYSLNNTRQLTVATVMYADDHHDNLPYNLGLNDKVAAKGISSGGDSMALNWVNNVLDWELSPDNTNSSALLASGLGPYTGGSAKIYRCPADSVLSAIQQNAGWNSRVRSYSMNAMVGDAGSLTQSGKNENNPEYLQFFRYSSIPRPSDIFIFVEEHPDSIKDGYFLNRSDAPKWIDLPASDHDDAGVFSFADGHSEMHHWRRASTTPAARPDGANLPIWLKTSDLQDFLWVLSTMSVNRNSEYYHY